MNQLKLNVETRTQTGRNASRRVRKANKIPAILYGKHTKPDMLAIDAPEFAKLYKSIVGRAAILNLAGSKDKSLAFIQEIQRDPITDKYLHVDLQEVKADEKFEVEVPVQLFGESFGVKNQSGVLETASHKLRVRCLPKDLPPIIEIDVTELKVGETIKVGNLKTVNGVEFMDDAGQPVVSCVEPVGEVASSDAASSAGAPAAAAPAADAKAAAPAGDAKAAAPAAAAPAKK